MKKAFTLVEIIIVISVMMILTGLASLSLVSSSRASGLDEAKLISLGAIREGQNNSLAGVDGLAWGVHLEENRLIIFADSGSGFRQEDAKNQKRILPSGAVLSWSITGGGAEVFFSPRTGETPNFGTLTLNFGDSAADISLSPEGVIDY